MDAGRLTQAVDAAVAIDVGCRSDSDIRETVASMRRNMDRQDAYMAEMLVAMRHRSIQLGDGAASVPAWMQWHTGQRFADAKTSLEMGAACETMPLTLKAWRQGEISTSAARTICRGRRPGSEAEYADAEERLVAFAADRDFRRLDATIRHYQKRADAVRGKPPADKTGVQLSPVGNRWALRGDIDQLAGTTLDTAVRAAIGKPAPDDNRGFSERFADGLNLLARFFLDFGELSEEGREVPHVTLMVNWETLMQSRVAAGNGCCDRGHATPPVGANIDPAIASTFTDAQIDELLCEANITRVVLGPDRVPLDVGRATRNPSKPLRRAVVARDGCCRFPRCDRRAQWCRTHHVYSWICGGDTKLCNLVLLCDFHHHIVHLPGWITAFDGITFTVTNPDGRVIGST